MQFEGSSGMNAQKKSHLLELQYLINSKIQENHLISLSSQPAVVEAAAADCLLIASSFQRIRQGLKKKSPNILSHKSRKPFLIREKHKYLLLDSS